jgi:acyl-CoA thioester hydrolase
MKNVFYKGQVLWSMIDANRHLRHSAYADIAAQARLGMLNAIGFDEKHLAKFHIGPILFREELVYFKEIGLNDTVDVTCTLKKSKPDGSRWSFSQEIFRSDGIKAADVFTDGAWIDLKIRKLAVLPPELLEKMHRIPRTADFVEG